MHPLPGYKVTTPYGVRGPWAAGYHTGEDYSTHGQYGIPVRAARGGRVVSATGSWGEAYGTHVVLEGRMRRVRVGYCHLDSSQVENGQWVRRGDVLGLSGSSGRSTGPHLHYEERTAPFLYADNRRPRFSHRGVQTLRGILGILAQRR